MTAIANALNAGHSANKILKYLSQQNPELSEKISQALNAGHAVDHVLNFISKNEKKIGKLIPEKKEIDNPFRKAQTSIHPALSGAAKSIGTAAMAMGGGYALSRAIPSILQKGMTANALNASSAIAQSSPLSEDQNNMPQASSLQDSNILSPQQPPANQIAASIPEPANIQQAEVKTNIVDVLWNDLDKSSGKKFGFESDAFLKIARRMKSTGEIRSKEDFQNLFNRFEQKKNEGKNLPEALREASIEFDEEKLSPTKKEDKIETPKIEKKSIVSSPQGIGTVKEIKEKTALVEIDGKLTKVDIKDLESSPLPEKELADLYDELIGGIEKESGEDVSRMVQWAGYDPGSNTLQFLPHTGALYTYDDISEEDAELLRDILSTRKTSGENFIGAWKKDSKSPIGAALSKLIRKLQSERGGKGNEYLAKHEPIYSAYEPAIQAKKRKKKK